ncbi:MAG TPA: heme o synthase [Candidatus Saccharimonadales bacterium]|nr:heme o synthase [Candidatus Saccharimonadales bacterium]
MAVSSRVTEHSASAGADSSLTIAGKLKDYYYLTKPGIVYSNTLTVISGYLFAAYRDVHGLLLLCLTFGTALIIASACVSNNILDRNIDARMKRTSNRALVIGSIGIRNALFAATIMGIAGLILLSQTNNLTLIIGAFAFISYVFVYGYAKRNSRHGTLIGTVPGAASLVAGYTAVTDKLDLTAGLLIVVMAAWQMAHFYAIAIFRLQDYKSAKIPVWPAIYGINNTKTFIYLYIALFGISGIILGLVNRHNYILSCGMLAIGSWWFIRTWRSKEAEPAKWARRTFGLSLVALLVFIVILPLSVIISSL